MNFTGAIIRGAGNQIGRSIAKTAINTVAKGADASYVNVKGGAKRGRPAESEFSKALSFDMSGSNKASTIENKLFHLINEFENQMTYENAPDILTNISLVGAKLIDVYEFFEFKNYDKSNIDVLKSKFADASNKGSLIFQKYNLEMVIQKTKMLKSRKRTNIFCVCIGIFCMFIPFFFIKSTSNLKLEIIEHNRLSNINVKIS